MGMMNKDRYKNWKMGDHVKYTTDTGPGKTKQEFAKETDVNYIVKRYNATGQLPVNMASLQPVFADVSKMGDFASAMQRVKDGESAFKQLPVELRSRFGHSAANFVAFIQDDSNREEAVKLGLVAAPVVSAAAPVVPAVAPVVPAEAPVVPKL